MHQYQSSYRFSQVTLRDLFLEENLLSFYSDSDAGRNNNGYNQGEGIVDNSLISIPYTLDYITTNKKFVKQFDVDTNSTKLMFGNGLHRFNVSGSSQSSIFSTIEQAGITLNGVDFSLIM